MCSAGRMRLRLTGFRRQESPRLHIAVFEAQMTAGKRPFYNNRICTRFVATEECDAAPSFKTAYLESSTADIKIIESPVGLAARAIETPFLQLYNNRIWQTVMPQPVFYD